MTANAPLKSHPRTEIVEQEFTVSDPHGTLGNLNYELTRFRFAAAIKIHFRAVSFKYCIFDDCYFRDCRFEDCDFTGSVFRNTILRGSTFDGSRFDYCRFAHTFIPLTILERHMPGYENVALELARALRVNYAQIGDSVGVNRAISAELAATRIHLEKVVWSNESYYRNKHRGWNRVVKALELYTFKSLDFIWGNGESLPKLIRTTAITYAVFVVGLARSGVGFAPALRDTFVLAWGSYGNAAQIPILAASAAASRTLLFGLFIALLVRRLSRR
jgi:hypothetical protein